MVGVCQQQYKCACGSVYVDHGCGIEMRKRRGQACWLGQGAAFMQGTGNKQLACRAQACRQGQGEAG
eukprot:1154420-Pelagomonas_calceolata.AAC.4